MKLEHLERSIAIHKDVTVTLDLGNVTVTGPLGSVSRVLVAPGVYLENKGDALIVYAEKATRAEKRIINTFIAHIQNMIKGVTDGFVYKLKICSGHFPMKVTVDKNTVFINNFLGGRTPRLAKVLNGVKVLIEDDVISVNGVDLEKTGQTAANMERATRITNRDRRIFMDGLWIFAKPDD